LSFKPSPLTSKSSLFSLYFSDSGFSFERVPGPSHDPKDLSARNIPRWVCFPLNQIAQIRRATADSPSAVFLYFSFVGKSQLPRFVFHFFPEPFVLHVLEFFVFKRVILSRTAATFLVSDQSQEPPPTFDEANLTPQYLVEFAMHNKILQSPNFRWRLR
jgi:hypothetical protein